MTLEEFQAAAAPPELSSELIALWHDAHGNWDRAHECVQDSNSADAAWVHAYLHRKEGDPGNAAYWYSRARKPYPDGFSLEDEWTNIVTALLAR